MQRGHHRKWPALGILEFAHESALPLAPEQTRVNVREEKVQKASHSCAVPLKRTNFFRWSVMLAK